MDNSAPEVSHPSWVRGLKHNLLILSYKTFIVAPLVGAWIETPILLINSVTILVAPLVGAWIETIASDKDLTTALRRTPRGCVD